MCQTIKVVRDNFSLSMNTTVLHDLWRIFCLSHSVKENHIQLKLFICFHQNVMKFFKWCDKVNSVIVCNRKKNPLLKCLFVSPKFARALNSSQTSFDFCIFNHGFNPLLILIFLVVLLLLQKNCIRQVAVHENSLVFIKI